MFPSIPTIDTLNIVEKMLSAKRIPFIKQVEILEFLKTCLDQNYFEFSDNMYKSHKGLIMGNLLSPLLAEIFMDLLDNQITSNPFFKHFLYWHRYVDDILTCFVGTERQLSQFSRVYQRSTPQY